MPKSLKFFNDNHWATIASIGVLAICFYVFGCQSRVPSLADPAKKVTRAELQDEFNTVMALEKVKTEDIIARTKTKIKDLDTQDETKNFILDQANLFATTGSVSPVGILGFGASIFSIGWGLDSNRKLKAANATAKTNVPNPPTA
jgi:hypothetical protein